MITKKRQELRGRGVVVLGCFALMAKDGIGCKEEEENTRRRSHGL